MTDRVLSIRIEASPAAAWAALTDPEILRRWYFDTAVRTTWEVGSPIEFVGDDGEVAITGVVLAYDPPRSYSHTFVATWGPEPDDQGSLTWTVEPDGDGCRVTQVHAGGHGEETADGSRQLLDALQALLESD